MNFRTASRALVLAMILALVLSGTALAAVKLGVIRMPTIDGSVNVRTGPGTRYRVRGWALHGDRVILLSEGKSWDYVRVMRTGVVGHISRKYVTRMVDVTKLANWGTMARIKTKYATSTVALRAGPGTRYTAIRYLSPANALAVLGKYGSWYEVQLVPSLTTGYVYKDYITNGAYGVTSANVNLRKSGSSSGKRLRTVAAGDDVVVLKIGAKWSRVTHKGKAGYMHNNYIAVTNLAP